jgi:predicted RNase H-like HicB family nuclease
MNALSYRVLLREEPEGGYTVTVPSLPGCVTYGATVGEAIAMGREAIELYLESLAAHDEPIPAAGKIARDEHRCREKRLFQRIRIPDPRRDSFSLIPGGPHPGRRW